MPDPKLFRQVMGQYATGITVVATQVGHHCRALTVNSFTSVSLDPLLVLFCLDKRARMGELLTTMSGFTVSVLRADQQDLSTYFAGAWKHEAPPAFEFIGWHHGPRIAGTLAALACERDQVIEAGDHWIVTARVIDLHLADGPREPLLYYAGQYRHLSS
jgi:flavin reductase (DIM6/NTAB) family NADH-FMN oxidoreductase RutF